MGLASLKQARRVLRKVLGPDVADLVTAHQVRIAAMSEILHRGFVGRLRWLLFGK